MTLLDEVAPGSLPPPPTPVIAPAPEQPRPTFTSDLLATFGLTIFSIVVAAGFARAFSGWAFLDGLVVLVVLGHGLGLCARRLRLPTWLTIAAMTVVLAWTIGFMFFGSTYSWGLPTAETWSVFTAELSLVGDQFSVAVAPVLHGGGWDVLAAIGMAIAVVLAEAFAFGAQARAEALVPGGVLFVFVAALGDDRLRVPLTVALVGAGVLATVLLRLHHAPAGATRQRTGSMVRVIVAAVVVASMVALGAGFVGQRLPGARAQPVFDTRGVGTGSGNSLDPLVDIRSRLTNRSAEELFVVDANLAAYWRLAALADFDGRTWSVPNRELGSPQEANAAGQANSVEVRQAVRIVALGGSLVPAAADPVAASPDADSGSQSLQFDSGTETLSTTQGQLARSDSFRIVSKSPRVEPAELENATATDPGDPIYFQLPDGFPSSAQQLAQQVTAGTTTPYGAAMALQNWFRSEFRYSLEVQPGHGNKAIEAFLRDRVGYCEQFAGTFAAMMRSLGYPARVGVGYTTGRALGGNSYSVAGKNSHAWPEVWFDGVGWLPFEPTPGRGAPGAESYTGLAAAQDATQNTQIGAGTPDANPTATTVAPGRSGSNSSALEGPTKVGTQDNTPARAPVDSSSFPWIQFSLVAALAVVIAAPIVVRRIRRRSVGRTPAEQIVHLWGRAVDALHDVGVPTAASDTPTETALITSQAFPVASRPVRSLAEVVTTATYHPDRTSGFEDEGAYGSSVLRDSAHWTKQIERAVTESMSTSDRVRRYFTRWH